MRSKLILLGMFAVVLSLGLSALPANADVITLRNGDTVQGEVTEVTRTKVTIKTKLHNIATTQTFRRSEIEEIEYAPLPDGFWTSPRGDENEVADEATKPEVSETSPRDRTPRADRSRDPDHQYVVVPVKGGIGSEVTAEGVRRALGQSKTRGVGHIVFVVDSLGGYVYEAVSILDVLKEFDDDFEYHCLIEEGAISAACVFAAGADRIFVRPDARLGGAVAYSKDNTSGAAEVDAKFNSIWSANLASRADAKGHPGDVFRAMVVMAAEVWQHSDGTLLTALADDATQIDGPDTILTIRSSQMVRAGMATEFKGELDELGTVLGQEQWNEVPGIGIRAMTFTARDRADMERRYKKAIDELEDATERFKEADPRRFSYQIVRYENGIYRLDAPSMRDWIGRSDQAIKAGNSMLKCLRELASVTSKAERTGAMHLMTPEDVGKETYDTVRKTVSWLKAHRNDPPAKEMGNPTFGP